MSKSKEPWYKDGVRFKCEGVSCGACCSGKWGSGYVWLSQFDLERLAGVTGMSVEDFGRRFVRQVGMRLSLVEKPNQDCVFYQEGKGCTVYEGRPNQCRAYPFWDVVMESLMSWNGEKKDCPGINEGGPEDHFCQQDIDTRIKMHTRGA